MSNYHLYAWKGQRLFLIILISGVLALFLSSCSDEVSGPNETSNSPGLDLQAVSAVDLVKGASARVSSDAKFKVFDATYFRPKPWAINNYGLEDIKMAYPPSIWGVYGSELEGTAHMPDRKKVTKLVKKAVAKGIRHVSFNIEHWPLEGSDTKVKNSIDRFIRIVDWVEQASPKMKVGFYSMPPVRKFVQASKPKSSNGYQEWYDMNMELKRLARNVDVMYPSLYTFNNDREKWVKDAKSQIEVARELAPNKPVYVFLWPQYHPMDRKFRGKFLPDDFWKLQLQTARKYADGVVIYTPRKLKWNNSARWWKTVKRFMVDMDKVSWWDDKYGN